jgi:salicylate hydroxylase
LIAGGGIGGLAAALSVSRHCPEVRVFERNDEFSESGAGIQLGPNAFRALRPLGLNEAVCCQAVFVDEIRLMDGTTGRALLRLPVKGSYVTRFREPYAVVHRGELHRVLLDACRASGRVELSASTEIAGYEQNGASVCALARDGRRFDGSVLIGADGIRSNVREQMVGDGSPRVPGHTIYRSVIPMDDVPTRLHSNSVTVWAAPGWHFVHYPIAGGSRLNLAAIRDDRATAEIVGEPVEKAQVRREFAEAGGVPGELIELGVDWRRWVLCDRDLVDTWVDGRAALLGDAAHPMLQYAAQGACMALETRWCWDAFSATAAAAPSPRWSPTTASAAPAWRRSSSYRAGSAMRSAMPAVRRPGPATGSWPRSAPTTSTRVSPGCMVRNDSTSRPDRRRPAHCIPPSCSQSSSSRPPHWAGLAIRPDQAA